MSTSTIDAFLTQIQQSISSRNASRLNSFIVLNFESLAEDQRKPYSDLHTELNNAYAPGTPGADAALATKVKQSCTEDVLGKCQLPFSEVVVIYFRYVRDFPGDSPLVKARKIERLTRQCILALRDEQPGPLFIPLVLHLTSTLRHVAINLDRDPTLTAGLSSDDPDGGAISFVENTGNVLREAFNKCIQRSKSTVPPSHDRLDSGLYKILNSCMSLYARAGKLRNAEFLLGMLDKTSPPLSFYPASQRVTYLYFLGRFHFGANHFYRAVRALTSAYDQCAKNKACEGQRRQILIYLIASGMCLGRMPGRILLVDSAAHSISKSFVELAKVIKSGDIGRFHTLLDWTDTKNTSAQWFLAKGVILQLKTRCEVICWRNLILKCMRYAGYMPDSIAGRPPAMPYLRFKVIMAAARYSFASARAQQFTAGAHAITLSTDHEYDYQDPDFRDDNDDSDTNSAADSALAFGNGMFGSTSATNTPATSVDGIDHLALLDPTIDELNSTVLSLISQGLLKGFVAFDQEDMLKSRFAIPGARKNAVNSGSAPAEPWREVGFPTVWHIEKEKEEIYMDDDDDVPGWVTEAKVRRQQSQNGGGGFVVNLKGARAVGSG